MAWPISDPNDSFSGTDGDGPDDQRWTQYICDAIAPMQVSSNKMRWNRYEGNITVLPDCQFLYSNFYLTGAFDIEVSYTVNTLNAEVYNNPEYPGLHLGVVRRYYPSTDEYLNVCSWVGVVRSTSTSTTYMYDYKTWVNASPFLPSGKLRLTRDASNNIRAFYWNSSLSRWEYNGSTSGELLHTRSAGMIVRIGCYAGKNGTVDVSFYDFKVNSGTVVWPPDGYTFDETDETTSMTHSFTTQNTGSPPFSNTYDGNLTTYYKTNTSGTPYSRYDWSPDEATTGRRITRVRAYQIKGLQQNGFYVEGYSGKIGKDCAFQSARHYDKNVGTFVTYDFKRMPATYDYPLVYTRLQIQKDYWNHITYYETQLFTSDLTNPISQNTSDIWFHPGLDEIPPAEPTYTGTDYPVNTQYPIGGDIWYNVQTALQRAFSWVILNDDRQGTSWTILNNNQLATAWDILNAAAVGIAWDILNNRRIKISWSITDTIYFIKMFMANQLVTEFGMPVELQRSFMVHPIDKMFTSAQILTIDATDSFDITAESITVDTKIARPIEFGFDIRDSIVTKFNLIAPEHGWLKI